MQIGNRGGQRQAQAVARFGAAGLAAIEALENLAMLGGWHAGTVIAHAP